MSIAQAEKASQLTAPALPFRECSEHPGVLSSLVDAILDAILQMETWRKEQDDPGTQSMPEGQRGLSAALSKYKGDEWEHGNIKLHKV